MANRIRGTTMIIDATGAAQFPGVGEKAMVSAIAFWAANSTGAMNLSYMNNSSDVVIKMASPVDLPNTTTLRFPENTYLRSLWVNTLTAGTGFVYFA